MSANAFIVPFDRPTWLSRFARKRRSTAQPEGADLILSELTIGTVVTTAADAEPASVAETTALSLAHSATMLERVVISCEPLPAGATRVTLRGFAPAPVNITLTVHVVSTEELPDGQQQVELAARMVIVTECLDTAQTVTAALLASVPHHVKKPLVVARSPRACVDAITPAIRLDWRKRWSRWRTRP